VLLDLIQEKRVRNRSSVLVLSAAAAVVGCTAPVNTVPEPVSPSAAVQYYDLEVPQDLEIRTVDFGATTYTEVSGGQAGTSSTLGGRAFVKAYAVHRTTGEHYLLLYEDIANRRRPVQVIRFVRGQDAAKPDSIR
jgi:hypothetical protein